MNTYKLPQVYLKILKEEDYKLILDLYSNKETAYWSGIKKIQSKQAAERFIYESNSDSKVINYVIKDSVTQISIGVLSLFKTELFRKPTLEIGYAILPQYRNKGYAKSSIIKIHEMITSHDYFIKYKYLMAKYYTDNLISSNLLHSFGFVPVSEGTTIDIYGNQKRTKLVYRNI